MSWVIREFNARDLAGCRRVIESNTPVFFTMEETAEFVEDLERRQGMPGHRRWPYFVLVTNQRVRGCGGYAEITPGTATLIWGMVSLSDHRSGLGTALLRYRLRHMPSSIQNVDIDTTPGSFGFYEKHGFVAYDREPDGYGPGLDKILARLSR